MTRLSSKYYRRARCERARRARARGVTLFEVLIVVAIMAMVAGGVAVFALPKFREAQITNAETGARTDAHGGAAAGRPPTTRRSCPTISQLVQEKQLDPGQNTNDPWGQPYKLNARTTT